MTIRNRYILIVVLLATFLGFWKVGQADVNDWDEARNGVNAYEMYHNGNYTNLYFDGAPDTWNAKPPLMTWLIVASYHVFGFNEFAFRLPAVLSAIFFFVFFYKLVDKYAGEARAFMCCLVLLSCKAVLGTHVGITGDYDALLLLLLTISAYCFILYIDFGRPWAICLTCVFTGLAFYTKGTAAFIFVPGFILYLLYRGRLITLIKDVRSWIGVLLFAGIVASWVLLVALHGQYNTTSHYGSSNALETMLVHDTFRRLTSTGFEQVYQPNHFFVFATLDTRLNLWNYLFYMSIVTGVVLLYKNRNNWLAYIRYKGYRLTVFSICMALPLMVILTVATNKHSWYLVPALPFVVLITVTGVSYLADRWKPMFAIAGCIFLFTFVRHFVYINGQPHELHNLFDLRGEYFKNSRQIVLMDTQPAQRILLYLEWPGKPITHRTGVDITGLDKGTILVIKNADAGKIPTGSVHKIGNFDDCYLAIVN